MTRRIVVTGAPGSGKTAMLAALAHLAIVVPEPARKLIAEHRAATGDVSLDHLPQVFVDRLVARSIENYDAVEGKGAAFFDRALPDCVAYAHILGVDPLVARRSAGSRPYDQVFILPPWEAIYTTDGMRKMRFADAQPFHDALIDAYEDLGYDLVEVPRTDVDGRACFVASRAGIAL